MSAQRPANAAPNRVIASPHLGLNDADMMKVAFGGETATWLLAKANEACARLEAEAAFSRSESDALLRDVENRLTDVNAACEAERSDKAVLTVALSNARKCTAACTAGRVYKRRRPLNCDVFTCFVLVFLQSRRLMPAWRASKPRKPLLSRLPQS